MGYCTVLVLLWTFDANVWFDYIMLEITLCMLGDLLAFCYLLIFFLNFQHYAWPDLGPSIPKGFQ